MLSERDIEAAHPDAFDFVWGNLPGPSGPSSTAISAVVPTAKPLSPSTARSAGSSSSCRPTSSQAAGLEDRTVAAMVAALAGEQAEPDRPADTEDRTATRVYRIPERQPPAEPEPQLDESPVGQPAPAEPQVRPMVTRLPVWRRYRGRLAAIVAAAAVIIVATALILPRLLSQPAQVTVVIPLHATAAAKVFGVGSASGQATARQVGESWTFDLTVRGLKPLPGNDVYVCWWAAPSSTKLHPLLATGGSFVVGDSGPVTLTMTTGVDPRQFSMMEITAESPGNGAIRGVPLLIG